MKFKKCFIIIFVLILVCGSSGFGVYYFFIKDKASFSPCVDKPFMDYPVDMNKVKFIAPLGNLNPPDHTFPTDHIGFYPDIKAFQNGFDIFSPGNITINRISKISYDKPHGNISEEYSINFDVCRHVSGKFGHISNISSFLWDNIEGFGEEYGDDVRHFEVPSGAYTSYDKQVSINVPSGQLLGVAGIGGAYDFFLKDERVTLEWINQEWVDQYQHTVCPLSYFEDNLKTNMEAKLGHPTGPDFPAGYCGKIDFDVPNTAQGIWAQEDHVDNAESHGLALVYSNYDPSRGAISIGFAGNSSWDSRVYTFTPKNNGLKNRNFSQVTNDGNVYYYSGLFDGPSICKIVILLKMKGDRELLIQVINQEGKTIPKNPSSLFNEALAIRYIR